MDRANGGGAETRVDGATASGGRYRLLFDRNPQPMWVHDIETRAFLAVNEAALEHYGYAEDEFLSMRLDDLAAAGNGRNGTSPNGHDGGVVACRQRRRDGSEIDVELRSDDLPFEGRRAKLVVAVDVTEHRRASKGLQRHADQQAVVVELGAKALEGVDLASLMDDAARVVADTLDVELSEVLERNEQREGLILRAGAGWQSGLVRTAVLPLGSSFYTGFAWGSLGQVVVEDYATERRFKPTPLLRGHEVVSGATVLVGTPGHPFGLLSAFSTARRVFGDDEVNFLKAVANVLAEAVQRQAAEERIRHQALHDSLTGLPNRTLLLDRLTHWLDRAERSGAKGAVVFIDLDGFKVINDGLGHDCGDQLLLGVAERLREVTRGTDTVARVGGDEFVCFCEEVASERAALAVVERFVEQLQDPFLLDGGRRQLTASIGIALASAGSTPEALLRDADAAMYLAKEQGGGRFELFDHAMRARTRRWLDTERELRRAIENAELFNVYQPVISAQREVVGFEALVRWAHPTRGTVPPADFIPVAEQSGLIIPLGHAVLREACREAATWGPIPGTDRPLSVSVNLSPRQVAHSALLDTVASILKTTGLDPRRLNLEITENVLIQSAENALVTLRGLKELGIRLVLDDFGTGYSSLGYVKRFPIDVLKIDRSFISGLGTDTEDSAIVSAILSMGRALGIDVVAEGVETCDQVHELATLGCDLAQGFLFARPMRPEAVRDFLVRAPAPCASE